MDATDLLTGASRRSSQMPASIEKLPEKSCGGVGSAEADAKDRLPLSGLSSMRPVIEEGGKGCGRNRRPSLLGGQSDSSVLQNFGRESTAQHAAQRGVSCGPLPTWEEFFENCEDIRPEADSPDVFRLYSAGDSGPVLLLLHGAGHSALSWCCLAREMREGSHPPVRLFAYDARGHGSTHCANDSDLHVQTLVDDGLRVLRFVYQRLLRNKRKDAEEDGKESRTAASEEAASPLSKSQDQDQDQDQDALPSVILVGHSMGGAVATRMAASGNVAHLDGLVVLDAVEGTALAALPQMTAFVSRFPTVFTSRREAVNWSIFAGILSNISSASVSIPSQLVKTTRGALTAAGKGGGKGAAEEEIWTWRVNLSETEPFWEGWFKGMSHSFLASRCVKILICSSNDRLDKELMIAHMQGKFQVQVIRGSGHVIEEDQPAELCRLLHSFISRYRLHLPPSKRVAVPSD